MASRSFFAYDPYDYYYTSPYRYPQPQGYPYYYKQHPASATEYFPAGGYGGEPARGRRSRLVSVPVQFVGPQPGREELRAPAPAPAPAKKRVRPSKEEAAVRVQAAARGFLARRMVREVRAVERGAEVVAAKVATEAEALGGDARGRVAVGEALMRMLLRLDAVRGAREYRKKVTKKVLALQDAVDALEPRAPAAVEMEEANAAEDGQKAPESQEDAGLAVDMAAMALAAGKAQMAPESTDDGDHGVDIKSNAVEEALATDTAAEMEVDEARSSGERGADEAVGGWEMVGEESVAATSDGAAPEDAKRRKEPAEEKKAEGGAAADADLDARKVMQMVAALCERSAQQCEVIGALAARVDSLERAVRRVEDAERRRRRNKKLKKEVRGSSKCAARSCYSDF